MNLLHQLFKRYSAGVFAGVVILILMAGWRLREYELITAEKGWGYAFGIIGFAMMATLMLYPLRKRFRFFSGIGGVKMWFRIHMMLGIVGPVFILFHCNFQLGSFNSNIALFSMLVVSSSGIFGRYFYSRIHHGLYGQRATLVGLRAELDEHKKEVSPQLDLVPGIKEELFTFTENVMQPPRTLWEGLRRRFVIRWQVFRLRQSVRKTARTRVKDFAADHHWSGARQKRMVRQMVRKTDRVIAQTLKVAEFGLFERLFVFWHLFHIPLVYMLFIAAVIHIVAVHLY